MKKKKSVRYDKLTTAGLRKATREFDREKPASGDGLPGRPLRPAERAKWHRVRKKLGRPKLGRGVKRVLVSIEVDLLHESDQLAREKGLSRSSLISAGLRKLLAS